MIKNLFFSSCVIFSSNAFSFWPIKDFYGHSSSHSGKEEISKLDLRDSENINWKKIKNCFLYDKHTCNRISLSINDDFCGELNNHLTRLKTLRFKFLTCDFTYDQSFWKNKNLDNLISLESTSCFIADGSIRIPKITPIFIYKKQLLYFKEDGSIEQKKDPVYKKFLDWDTLEGINYINKKAANSAIHFQKSFSSLSGIKIENIEDKVLLKKNGRVVNLDSALKAHWNRAEEVSLQNLATFLIKRCKGINESLREIDKFNDFPMSQFDLERLNSSKILALWRLIPIEVEIKDHEGNVTKKTIESQMLGLAEDKEGNLFHWTTDLGADISCLIPELSSCKRIETN